MQSYIELKNIKKYYHMGEVEIKALHGVEFTIDKGKFIANVISSFYKK